MKRMILGVLLLAAAGLFSSAASAESFTWRFTNNSGELASFELYSKSRNHVWPGNRRVFLVPADGQTHSYSIRCSAGEYICYGAWIGRAPNLYWGSGPGGRQGCGNCCYRCTGGESQVYNLVNGDEGC